LSAGERKKSQKRFQIKLNFPQKKDVALQLKFGVWKKGTSIGEQHSM
jgi:hypothetical protein